MKIVRKAVNKHIGELLIERGAISQQHLEKALEHQRQYPALLGEILLELKFVSQEDIAKAITSQYGFPFLPLSDFEIEKEAIAVVPRNICERFCLIPIDRIGKSLTLAMANPTNIQAIEDVELITGCAVQSFVSTPGDIKEAIKKYYASAP